MPADKALPMTPSAKSATASAVVSDVAMVDWAGVAGSVDCMDDIEDGGGGGVHARYWLAGGADGAGSGGGGVRYIGTIMSPCAVTTVPVVW